MSKNTTQVFVDHEKIIEAGWLGLRKMWLHPDAPKTQVDEMRASFFAGAQHLFSSIIAMLDPSSEVTDADLSRMDSIQNELDKFILDFNHGIKTKGRC